MAAQPQTASYATELSEIPVDMLVIGCELGSADAFANALRNLGQAAHLKTADSVESLHQQVNSDPCELVVINGDSNAVPAQQAIEVVRTAQPHARILMMGKNMSALRSLVINQGLQDLIDPDDEQRVAIAIRREHQTLLLIRELAQLKAQIGEVEQRSNLLVQSSRDAIAYVHEGMFLGANQAFLHRFGYESFDEVDGLPIMDLIDASSRNAFKAALRNIEETGHHDEQFLCVNSEGVTFDAQMAFSPASMDGESCTQLLIREKTVDSALQQKLQELASKDEQTGFLNRHAFMARVEALVGKTDEERQREALIQISITNYAEIRESCGYSCAERMLTEVATLLTDVAGDQQTLARFGDHDFMIVSNDQASSADLADKYLKRLREHLFQSVDSSAVEPSYSVGVSYVEDGDELTAQEWVSRSCRATGMARAEGGNRVVVYNERYPGTKTELNEQDAAIVKLIDTALANDKFRLKFQPIVSLQGDTRENYAVYLRLMDESDNELEPETFLEQASNASRLAEVDRWVVRNAVRELANHRKDGKKVIFHLILSRAAIADDSMLLWICDCLREFRAKGSWLVFHFLESDLRGALGPATELIDGLKKINCRIAINNYTESAEPLLKQLSFDIVKLSPDFMHNLATDAGRQERMNTANRKLQEEGFKTIACGVEDAGSLAILWNLGVNYIQGYFLQEPSSTISFDGDHEHSIG